jgi:hypothetical protein
VFKMAARYSAATRRRVGTTGYEMTGTAQARADTARWKYRREAAEERARRIQEDAARLGEDLVLLSQCETDHEQVLRAIQRLVEELMLAQEMTLDFDCATRHAAEEPDPDAH